MTAKQPCEGKANLRKVQVPSFGPVFKQLADFVHFGVTAQLFLGENQLPVNRYLTHTANITLSLQFEIGGSLLELGLEQLADFVYLGMAAKLFL